MSAPLSTPIKAGTVARTEGLRLSYAGGADVLRGIDLDLTDGCLIALVGANGTGKTTLLRILGGFLRPSAGSVEVLGLSEPSRAGPAATRELRRRLAYVPQEPALDPEMTGAETLELMATLYGLHGAERRRRVDELAAVYQIDGHIKRRVGVWSGGLKRRLHLAAGMIHDPELLLLDEPTAGLDSECSAFLWDDLLRRVGQGRTAVVSTHDLAAVEAHAHCLVALDHGEVVAIGEPKALLAASGDASLSWFFHGLAEQKPKAKRKPGHRSGHVG